MEQIFQLIDERFSALRGLRVQRIGPAEMPERFLPFLGMLLAVMEAPSESPTCFVFPRMGEAGRLAIVLYALQQFVKDQKQVSREYVEANFTNGDVVRVSPGKHVFRYRGFDPDAPDCIKLEALHETGGWRRVRAIDIMNRLEKAKLKKPLGSLSSPIHSLPRQPIDEILGTSSYGNQSRIKNAIVLLDSQSGLKHIAESVAFLLDGSSAQLTVVDQLFPFGQLVPSCSMPPNWFVKWRAPDLLGEPLVAVTHSAELLANYCLSVPARSKLIAINGLSRLRNLQAYDEIAATQNLILFTDLDDEEMIESLGQRGCRFWWLSDPEFETGESTESNGLIGEVIRWSRNFNELTLEGVQCENNELEGACADLERLREAVTTNPEGPITKLVSQGWRILNDACAVIGPLPDSEYRRRNEQVLILRRDLELNKVWLSQQNIVALTSAADKLNSVFAATTGLGASKERALRRLLQEGLNVHQKCLVVVRNEKQVPSLNLWLQEHGFGENVKAYSPRNLPDIYDFNFVVCVSWLGFNLMRQTARRLMTPHLVILAYPFEQRWLKQFERSLKNRPSVPSVTSSEKTAFFSSDGKATWPDQPAGQTPTDEVDASETDIFVFESRLQSARKGVAAAPTSATDTVFSRYVSFIGDSYVFLTDSHKVPVATEFVSNVVSENRQLPERVVDHFKQGDFVVFPKSGSRELIQEVADKLLGRRTLELRALAHLWKDALWKCNISVEAFVRQAAELGQPRHVGTIRNWFADSSQIGPQTIDDLALVQIVTGNGELERLATEVWSAIEQLRGAHQSAGNRLRDVLLQRLPSVIGAIEDGGTEIDLGELGSAWVVQVEYISTDSELRGKKEVDRLLWEQASGDLFTLL